MYSALGQEIEREKATASPRETAASTAPVIPSTVKVEVPSRAMPVGRGKVCCFCLRLSPPETCQGAEQQINEHRQQPATTVKAAARQSVKTAKAKPKQSIKP